MQQTKLFKYLSLILLFTLILTSCKPDSESSNTNTSTASETKQITVTIGYQGMINPWKVAIHEQRFEQATGQKIEWRKFNSGSEVITAMASGSVQIAVAGSSPIATAMSRGLELELFWILEAIQDNEALIAHKKSGITSPADLKGKIIGVPYASTTHYHLLFALEHYGIPSSELTILNLQPDAIAASWSQNRIDAAFIWSPVLDELKKDGQIIVSSGELAKLGKPTFDGMIVQKKFAAEHQEFMEQFVSVLASADQDYREAGQNWSSDSTEIQAIATLSGASPEIIPKILKQYHFPNLEEQTSKGWLGGGIGEGAARALYDTSVFLKNQGKIETVQESYTSFINPSFAQVAKDILTAPPDER